MGFPVCQAAPLRERALFGEKLLNLRQKHGLNQGELARQLGLSSHSHLSNIESGRRTASLDVILRVAHHFDVSIDYLMRDHIAVEDVTPYPSGSRSTPHWPLLFGEKLRLLRTRRNLLQADLARHLGGLSQSHISLLESGQKAPSVAVVLQIANFFGVTTDTLMRDEILLEEQEEKSR